MHLAGNDEVMQKNCEEREDQDSCQEPERFGHESADALYGFEQLSPKGFGTVPTPQ